MTPVERVARAIWLAREMSFEPRLRRLIPDEIDWSTGAFAICMAQARAAIEALREPTDVMVDAGYGTDDPIMGHDCAAIWRLMIDAALKE